MNSIKIQGEWQQLCLHLPSRRVATIVGLSVLGGLVATWIMPYLVPPIAYDYGIYMQGARLIRSGQNAYAALPFWYPLPIVLFTIVPWSFLPDQFVWAFAVIPLGLLHLRYGRRAIGWWLFFPLLINVMYGQAEGWLILPLFWLLEDTSAAASIGIIALMFKPAYGIFLVPYRVYCWVRGRRWRQLAWLLGLNTIMFSVAFLIDPIWPLQWIRALIQRHDLVWRDISLWSFGQLGERGTIALCMVLALLVWLIIPLLRAEETRGEALLALSLFFFPNGLYPVSTMMILPLVRTASEIFILVAISWLVAVADVMTQFNGTHFAGLYLIIVLVALALRRRRYEQLQGQQSWENSSIAIDRVRGAP